MSTGSEDKSTEMKFDTLKKVTVTLKIKSRSPKSNQLFTPSQHCIYASLVKICPLVQKITTGNETSYITKGRCDLENLVKVTKNINNSSHPPNNASVQVSSKYVHWFRRLSSEMKFHTFKKVAVTLKIKSRSPKSNQLFIPSQHCIYASLVKICPLVQKITPGNEISYITKGHCDLENWAKVTKI